MHTWYPRSDQKTFGFCSEDQTEGVPSSLKSRCKDFNELETECPTKWLVSVVRPLRCKRDPFKSKRLQSNKNRFPIFFGIWLNSREQRGNLGNTFWASFGLPKVPV